MTERDKILDDLKQAEGKATALARTIKTTGKELDVTREQYKTCKDVTERVRLAGLIDERLHALAYLNRNWARADWEAQQVRKQLHKLDKKADTLCALGADAPASLATWDKRISVVRRKMEGEQAVRSGYCPERTGTTTGACGECVDEHLTKWGNIQAAGYLCVLGLWLGSIASL